MGKISVQKISFFKKDRKKEKTSRLTSLGFELEPKAGHGSTFSDLGWVGSGDFLSGLGWVNPWVKSMGQTHGSKGEKLFSGYHYNRIKFFTLPIPKLSFFFYIFFKKPYFL